MTTTTAKPQHLEALELANTLRFARADVKRDLRAQRTTIAAVIDDPCIASMRVAALLTAQYRWGATRAREILREIPCSEYLAVRDLTARQRGRLLELLGQAPPAEPSIDELHWRTRQDDAMWGAER